jgi:hypothetical protein
LNEVLDRLAAGGFTATPYVEDAFLGLIQELIEAVQASALAFTTEKRNCLNA